MIADYDNQPCQCTHHSSTVTSVALRICDVSRSSSFAHRSLVRSDYVNRPICENACAVLYGNRATETRNARYFSTVFKDSKSYSKLIERIHIQYHPDKIVLIKVVRLLPRLQSMYNILRSRPKVCCRPSVSFFLPSLVG